MGFGASMCERNSLHLVFIVLEDIKHVRCDDDAEALLTYLCDPSLPTKKGAVHRLRARCLAI